MNSHPFIPSDFNARWFLLSGGQTGADRAGLDAAIHLGLPYGGWCPGGRRAEDGKIPDVYQLTETRSRGYLFRTEQNVIDSDATLIFTLGNLSGGSKRTLAFTKKHRKPCIHIGLSKTGAAAESVLRDFLATLDFKRLNVAGSRESKEPGVGEWAFQLLVSVLGNSAPSRL